jgi:hypothetical protein
MNVFGGNINEQKDPNPEKRFDKFYDLLVVTNDSRDNITPAAKELYKVVGDGFHRESLVEDAVTAFCRCFFSDGWSRSGIATKAAVTRDMMAFLNKQRGASAFAKLAWKIKDDFDMHRI